GPLAPRVPAGEPDGAEAPGLRRGAAALHAPAGLRRRDHLLPPAVGRAGPAPDPVGVPAAGRSRADRAAAVAPPAAGGVRAADAARGVASHRAGRGAGPRAGLGRLD